MRCIVCNVVTPFLSLFGELKFMKLRAKFALSHPLYLRLIRLILRRINNELRKFSLYLQNIIIAFCIRNTREFTDFRPFYRRFDIEQYFALSWHSYYWHMNNVMWLTVQKCRSTQSLRQIWSNDLQTNMNPIEKPTNISIVNFVEFNFSSGECHFLTCEQCKITR